MFEIVTSLPWVIVAVVGAFIVLFAVNKNTLHFSVEELVKSQIVNDEFDDHSLISWIKENRPATDIKILVVKPTAFWTRSLHLSGAEKIDTQRNLIGCIVDDKTEKVLTVRLFNFRSMSKRMAAKFGKRDEILLSA